MAKFKIKEKTGGSNRSWDLSGQPAEEGTYPGILLDILDNDEVLVKDFNNPGEMLERDVTRFLFAYDNDEGDTCLSMTGEMTQSADERSNLVKILTAIRGKLPPIGDPDYDYCDEIGKKVMVTIGTRTSKLGKEYGFVQSVAKISKKLEDDVPSITTEVPGDRRSPIPDWISEEEEEPAPKKKVKKSAPKKSQGDEEEDPF
jgi:hypothetical protein